MNNEEDKLNANVIGVVCHSTQNGITLIALIITIIILLILATITINVMLGENGLFNTAKNAGEDYQIAGIREKVEAMLAEYMTERYTNNKKLIDFLKEQKIEGKIQNVKDNNNGTYTIEVDGYDFTIKESDLSIIEISKSGPNPQITNVKITLENGITVPEDYSVELGTKLKIEFNASITGGKIKSIEPSIPYITNGTELEKQFIIIGDVDGTEYTKTITVSLKDKYMLKNPEIVLSNSEWTKNSIQVTVNWFNDNENLKKEISIDGGTTYQKYEGPIDVTKNCVIKAKISNDTKEAIGEIEVNKIDKLEPNTFTPTISDLVSSTELEIKAYTQDKDATEEYGKSGIKGYMYYVYKDGELIQKSDVINENSWIAKELNVGDTYDICVEAYDNAENVIKTEKISHTKLEVYKWAEYKANKSTTYSIKESSFTWKETFPECKESYFELLKTTNPQTFLNSANGKFESETSKNGLLRINLIAGNMYSTSSGGSHSVLYKVSSNNRTNEKKNGYDVYQIRGTEYTVESKVSYEKVEEYCGEVTSNNLTAYPDKDGQGDYWYERISD